MEKWFQPKLFWPFFSLSMALLWLGFAIFNFARAPRRDVYVWIEVEGDKEQVLRKVRGREARLEMSKERFREELGFTDESHRETPQDGRIPVLVKFNEGEYGHLIGEEGCRVFVKSRRDPFALGESVRYVLLAVGFLWSFLSTASNGLLISDSGLELRALLGTHSLCWNQCSWFHLWGKSRVVLGRAHGRAISIRFDLFRDGREVLAAAKERVGEPKRLKPKTVVILPAAVFAAGGFAAASYSTFVGYLLALGLGVVTAVCFLEIERRISAKAAVSAILGLCLCMIAAAGLVSSVARGLVGAQFLLSTYVLFSGWFGGFYFTRIHEGYMRGIIGDDWARPASPGEWLD